jgi:hypothetical protein
MRMYRRASRHRQARRIRAARNAHEAARSAKLRGCSVLARRPLTLPRSRTRAAEGIVNEFSRAAAIANHSRPAFVVDLQWGRALLKGDWATPQPRPIFIARRAAFSSFSWAGLRQHNRVHAARTVAGRANPERAVNRGKPRTAGTLAT